MKPGRVIMYDEFENLIRAHQFQDAGILLGQMIAEVINEDEVPEVEDVWDAICTLTEGIEGEF